MLFVFASLQIYKKFVQNHMMFTYLIVAFSISELFNIKYSFAVSSFVAQIACLYGGEGSSRFMVLSGVLSFYVFERYEFVFCTYFVLS